MDASLPFFAQVLDLILHLDRHLAVLVQQYGPWVYAVLFAIVFAETGFVVTPFLPGDSLLFVAGALAALGGMEISVLMATLFIAAVAGNSLNYAIGRVLGPKVFHWPDSRFFNRAALAKTHAFYERHGGKAVVMSRFLPIFRTFVPFVAGIGTMDARRFTAYNVLGAALWVAGLCLAGYWFGNIPVIRNNLSALVIGIVVVSLAPAVVGWWRHRQASARG